MAQPTPYARLYNFTTYAANNAAAPFQPAATDAEFNAIATTLAETLVNLAIIQRDDGNLRMAIVTPDALNTATLNLMGDWEPKGPWLPSQVYAKKDMVTVAATSYVCATAHTSSTFAIDLAAGYWQPVNQGESADYSVIVFTATDRILGRQTAGGGAGEEIVCTSVGRGLISSPTVASARSYLSLGSGNNPTFNNVTVSNLNVSGLTAAAFLYTDTLKNLATTAAPTNGQLLVGSTGAVPVLAALTGTANQVVVTNGAGSITLSLPQSIAAASTPSFATVNLTNLSLGSVVFVGASSALTQDTTNLVWDNTNKRLGVCENGPTAALTIGDDAGNPCRLTFLADVGGGPVELTATTDDLLITNSLTIRMLHINATDLRGYNTYTDASNYLGWKIAANSGSMNFSVETAGTGADNVDILLVPAGTGALEVRNGTAAQVTRGYRTFTDTSNYERWALQSGAGYFELAAQTAGTGTDDIDVRLTPSGIGKVSTAAYMQASYYSTSAPVTETGATHTVAATTAYLICDRAGTVTVTLPAAASFTGRQLTIKTIQAQQVDSNASNVVPRIGGAAGTVIVPNTDGAWTTLVSDGTNWIAMAGNA